MPNLIHGRNAVLEAARAGRVLRVYRASGLGHDPRLEELATLTRERGEEGTAARFEEDAQLAERYAALIQEHVLGAGPPGSRSNGGAEETNVPVPPPAGAASGGR